MTVRNKLEANLISNGMYEQQAKEIIDISIVEIQKNEKNISFNAPADSYPKVVYNALYLTIKPIALKWIEENKPAAWNKGLFM